MVKILSQRIRKKLTLFIICFLVIVNLLFLTVFVFIKNYDKNVIYPELVEISQKKDLNSLVPLFVNIAEKKGALYAYDLLRRADLNPNIDIHLLAHFIGEILYKQKGVDAMKYCTEEFTNACSHTVVVGMFMERGEAALSDIVKTCQSAPGGKNAYGLCFHGLGHGVLAYTGFDLPKAVGMCTKISVKKPQGNEITQCIGGTIMEIVGGGNHDKINWRRQHEKYLGTGDPLYPCNSQMIPDLAKEVCYGYITPNLFSYAGVSATNPQDEDFKKAFKYCEVLNKGDFNRNVCFGGFGKEFIGVVMGRDVRNISKMSEDQFRRIHHLCSLTDDKAGEMSCLYFANSSIFWGGDNKVEASISFCKALEDKVKEENCLLDLIKRVDIFVDDDSYFKNFCRKIPAQLKIKCVRSGVSS